MPTTFERIIDGELSADFVYEDDQVVAFRDINPQGPVHILIVPRKVIPTTNDITEEDVPLIGHLVLVAKRLATEEGIAEDGYRLIFNCNAYGGQEVFHIHLHLIGGKPLGRMIP
ncbi:MAG: histidine triad nucleotide-binding protein [Gammaproteobacteria bacterium]